MNAVCHVQSCLRNDEKPPTKIWGKPGNTGKTNALNFICECERFKMHNSSLYWFWLWKIGSISFYVILWCFFWIYFNIRAQDHKHSPKIYLFSLESNAKKKIDAKIMRNEQWQKKEWSIGYFQFVRLQVIRCVSLKYSCYAWCGMWDSYVAQFK